jgi:hypothetical protein
MKDKGYDAQFQEFPSAGHALNDDIKNAYMTFLKKIDK